MTTPHHELFNNSFKLAKDLGTLIGDEKMCDFRFDVAGREFAVNKTILAGNLDLKFS